MGELLGIHIVEVSTYIYVRLGFSLFQPVAFHPILKESLSEDAFKI